MSASRPLRLNVYCITPWRCTDPSCPLEHNDPVDDWRWSLVAGNGKVIDAATEGYTSRGGVEHNLRQTLGIDVRGIKPGEIVDVRRAVVTHRVGLNSPESITQDVRVEVIA